MTTTYIIGNLEIVFGEGKLFINGQQFKEHSAMEIGLEFIKMAELIALHKESDEKKKDQNPKDFIDNFADRVRENIVSDSSFLIEIKEELGYESN